MKQPGELLRVIPGLTRDDLTNFFRGGYLRRERTPNGRYLYPEKEYLLLKIVLPQRQSGMTTRAAFLKATGLYDQEAQQILNVIHEFREEHDGHSPNLKHIRSQLPHEIQDFGRYIDSLIEERRLYQDKEGRFTPLPVFDAPILRASTKLPASAYTLLTEERRLSLREVSSRLYFLAAEGSDERGRIPVSTTVIERHGFTLEYRNLPRGQFGGCDPENKTLFLSTELRRPSAEPKRRLVVMHEFFHAYLGHGYRACSWKDDTSIEAEATYAAVHYLVPLHTLDVICRLVTREARDPIPWITALAEKYMVSETVIEQYVREHPVSVRGARQNAILISEHSS
jgi:hypothetical protein